MLFVIEHLEPKLSEWLWIEYSHAVEIAGKERVMITNVRSLESRKRIQNLCRVEAQSVLEIFPHSELIILDPKARKPLTAKDFSSGRMIVVGGILGDDPPRGRTAELLSEKVPKAVRRNLGRKQFSIDGAVFVAMEVARGKTLGEIPVVVDVEISVSPHCSVGLPFAYPLVNGKPLISKRLEKYLKSRGLRF